MPLRWLALGQSPLVVALAYQALYDFGVQVVSLRQFDQPSGIVEQFIGVFFYDGDDNGNLHGLIIMNSNVAKARHQFHCCRELGLDQVCLGKNIENIACALR